MKLLLQFELADNAMEREAATVSAYGADIFDRPPDGVEVRSAPPNVSRSFAGETVFAYVFSFGSGVLASLMASWIHDRLKGRARSMTIDHVEVQLSKGEIEQVILTRMQQEQ